MIRALPLAFNLIVGVTAFVVGLASSDIPIWPGIVYTAYSVASLIAWWLWEGRHQRRTAPEQTKGGS